MAEMTIAEINASIQVYTSQIVGQTCTRCHIANDRSLFLGFGELGGIEPVKQEQYHGTWDIGTYRSSWRIGRGKQLICGSKDVADSVDKLRAKINQLNLGRCTAIHHLTYFDVRIQFDSDAFVDILATFSDDDEVLHIFFPQNVVVVFTIPTGWDTAPTNKPWNAGRGLGLLESGG